MAFTKQEIQLVQKKVEDAVRATLRGTGFDIETNRGTFGDTLAVKMTFKRVGEDGERTEWNSRCFLYGLEPKHFGAEFTNNGKLYKAVGFAAGRSKFVLRGRSVEGDGKELLFTEKTIEKIKSPRPVSGPLARTA